MTKQMMCCNNPCGAGVSSFCYHSIPHERNKHCPVDVDCNCTSGGKIARCVPVGGSKKMITCDEPGCLNKATYEVEWQDDDGFASVKLCDEHFPTDPNVTNVFCSIKKL
jgi:hypothetical protein